MHMAGQPSKIAPVRRRAFLLACCLSVALPPSALAQTTPTPAIVVAIQGKRFRPRLVTIRPGTTITWKNADRIAHNVTSTTGLFASDELSPIARAPGERRYSPGGSFSYTFDSTGFFSYRCTLTGTAGMVIVR